MLYPRSSGASAAILYVKVVPCNSHADVSGAVAREIKRRDEPKEAAEPGADTAQSFIDSTRQLTTSTGVKYLSKPGVCVCAAWLSR